MAETTNHDVTALLSAWQEGDEEALERLLPVVYSELRSLARRHLRRERRDHTLDVTDLVNEAFLRLVGQRRVDWHSRNHFFAIAAQAMRRVLVDHARRQRAGNRVGAGDRVSLERVGPLAVAPPNASVLDVDRSLERLAALDARQARLVELRFFGGLTVREAAAVLGVSLPTAVRDWKMAKGWLRQDLEDGDTGS